MYRLPYYTTSHNPNRHEGDDRMHSGGIPASSSAAAYYHSAVYKPPAPSNSSDDLSTAGSILGAVVCFLLFFLIIVSIAYPFTMYRTVPHPHHVYSDSMWWCYHCTAGSCASRCW
jgi:hypothetical protein